MDKRVNRALLTAGIAAAFFGAGATAAHADTVNPSPQSTNYQNATANANKAQQSVDYTQQLININQSAIASAQSELATQSNALSDKQSQLASAQSSSTSNITPAQAQANVNAKQSDLNNWQAQYDAANAKYAQLTANQVPQITLPSGTNASNMGFWSNDQWAQWASQVQVPAYQDNQAAMNEHVDLNHLTSDQNAQMQAFFGQLENSVLQQAGQPLAYFGANGTQNIMNQITAGYSQDNWSIYYKDGHDLNALNNATSNNGIQSSWRENYSSGFNTSGDFGIPAQYMPAPYNPSMTMNDVYKMIYREYTSMLTQDGDSNWGHTRNFLQTNQASFLPRSYWSVGFDTLGQAHFFSAMMPTPDSPIWGANGSQLDVTNAYVAQPVQVDTNAINQAKATVASLQTQVTLSKRSLAYAQAELGNTNNGNKQALISSLQNDIQGLTDTISQLRSQINTRSQTVNSLTQQLSQLKQQATVAVNAAQAYQPVVTPGNSSSTNAGQTVNNTAGSSTNANQVAPNSGSSTTNNSSSDIDSNDDNTGTTGTSSTTSNHKKHKQVKKHVKKAKHKKAKAKKKVKKSKRHVKKAKKHVKKAKKHTTKRR